MSLEAAATKIHQGSEALEFHVEPSTRIGANNAESFAGFAEAMVNDIRSLSERLQSRGDTWLRWSRKTADDARTHLDEAQNHYLAAGGSGEDMPLVDELTNNCSRISDKVGEARELTSSSDKVAEYVGRLAQLAADLESEIMKPAKKQWLLLSNANDIVEITLQKSEEARRHYAS